MLRLGFIHFVLLLLLGVAQSQSTTCKCSSAVYLKTYTFSRTYTGSAACSSAKLTSTCKAVLATSAPSVKTTTTPVVVAPSSIPKPTTPTSTPKPSSPSPTPSSTTPVAAPSSVARNSKRGVSYNSTPLTKLFKKSSWSWNWYSSPSTDNAIASYNTALQFVPTLWSAHPDLTSVWNANVNNAIAKYGTKSLFSFNEPDGCADGGSCMNVTYAAQSYKTWIQPFAGKVRLGSPGVTNGGSPMGLTYLQNFLKACTGCTVDFVNIHWYGDASQIDAFKSHVQQAYTAGGNRPLVISEFGLTSGTDAQVQTFLKAVLPWMDSSSIVEKYSYYSALPQNPSAPFLWQETLINQAGSALSPVGVVYDS